MGPPGRIAQYRAIETDPTAPQPFTPSGYFGLQQRRWPPTNIATTQAQALSRLFALPGSHYSAPEFSWKFDIAPGGLGFLDGNALGPKYTNDLFVGAARDTLEGGQLFRFNLCGARRALALSDPRLADLVADNVNKFDITESQSLLFGRDFGITTDIQTGPNGSLYLVSLTQGAIYEIFDAAPAQPKPPDDCPTSTPGPGPAALTLDLEAKKQRLKRKLKLLATASADSTLVAEGKAIKETTTELAANEATKVKAQLKRKQRRRLAAKLDRKGRAKTKVEATATDQGGATADDKVKVKLKG
jgi:hypothetical protein